ncbi:hypothetical protein LY76DRAFT_609796 [Colletotrichum caudatum]|nr:hypothetical protein LY76DRAFT_609796 [Colletotrichum caudatum]
MVRFSLEENERERKKERERERVTPSQRAPHHVAVAIAKLLFPAPIPYSAAPLPPSPKRQSVHCTLQDRAGQKGMGPGPWPGSSDGITRASDGDEAGKGVGLDLTWRAKDTGCVIKRVRQWKCEINAIESCLLADMWRLRRLFNYLAKWWKILMAFFLVILMGSFEALGQGR